MTSLTYGEPAGCPVVLVPVLDDPLGELLQQLT
jgi:hypothetical protein